MTKKHLLTLIAVIVLLGGIYFVYKNSNLPVAKDVNTETGAKSPRDATYIIDGKSVTLTNGLSETEAAAGSASKIITRYFGNNVTLDLNGDGREDSVFLLTQETGGSGTFFYVAAALNTESGYVGSQTLFLGDRIAPQTTEISRNPNHKNVIVVNYAVRAPGEPMTARPSMGKSIWLKFDPNIMQFGEVVQNFEGEADMSRLIQVSSPLPNQKVASPLKISGKAVGNWYFEASFPVKILDGNGKELGVVPAQAKSDWMTTEFVPFEATLNFEKPTTKTGTLILKKDNPSGLDEKAVSISIPVSF